MNKKILLSSLLCVGVLASCAPTTSEGTTSEKPSSAIQHAELSIALNYDGNNNRITYQGDKTYTTPSGKEIKKGDYKPVWSEVQKLMDVTLTEVEKACTGKAVEYFKNNWKQNQYADLAAANVTDINTFSVDGNKETILDLSKYFNKLPNFKAFLDANPAVKMSITSAKHGDATKGAIYYFPYFDGNDDLEKMTLVRADYVRKLFATGTELDTNASILGTNVKYTPTEADTSGNAKAYSVVVPTALGSKTTKKITKTATKNIITRQNELIAAGTATSAALVAQFKQYVTERYGTQFAKVEDLFLGVDSCYDADEMVALMRIVKASPKALTGDANKKMVAFVPREFNNSRIADLYRWAGQLWGVRGVESRSGYLYINSQNKLVDTRGSNEIVELLENLNKLYSEGLILENFQNEKSVGVSNGKFAASLIVGTGNDSYAGFMEYDYSQTQGVWNDDAASKAVEGYDFRPILGSVADWDDGDNSTSYYHFTESWRSVKTQGFIINAALENDPVKLDAALRLCDYFYSAAGQQLNSYGPEADGYTKGTIDYQGRKVAKFTTEALAQLNDKNIGKGSYTGYLRTYVGATLPVGYVKEQGMEYQCTSAKAIAGLDIINTAISAGTYKHITAAEVTNPFMKVVPSTFFLTQGQATIVKEAEAANKLGLINSQSSKEKYNIWDDFVMYGFGSTVTGKETDTKEAYLNKINVEFGLTNVVKQYQDAYDFMNE